MEATGSSIRYRANVTRNTKGYTVEWTVEAVFSKEDALLIQDDAKAEDAVLHSLKSFGAKLEAAYPATVAPEKVAANGKE